MKEEDREFLEHMKTGPASSYGLNPEVDRLLCIIDGLEVEAQRDALVDLRDELRKDRDAWKEKAAQAWDHHNLIMGLPSIWKLDADRLAEALRFLISDGKVDEGEGIWLGHSGQLKAEEALTIHEKLVGGSKKEGLAEEIRKFISMLDECFSSVRMTQTKMDGKFIKKWDGLSDQRKVLEKALNLHASIVKPLREKAEKLEEERDVAIEAHDKAIDIQDALRKDLDAWKERYKKAVKVLDMCGDLFDEMDAVSWDEDSGFQESSYGEIRDQAFEFLEAHEKLVGGSKKEG